MHMIAISDASLMFNMMPTFGRKNSGFGSGIVATYYLLKDLTNKTEVIHGTSSTPLHVPIPILLHKQANLHTDTVASCFNAHQRRHI